MMGYVRAEAKALGVKVHQTLLPSSACLEAICQPGLAYSVPALSRDVAGTDRSVWCRG
jgi:hypothetical protein